MFDHAPFPAMPKAAELAEKLVWLMQTREYLDAAKAQVPDYTGQHDPRDYYAAEQEVYNRAVDDFAEAAGVITQTELLEFGREQETRIQIVSENDLDRDPCLFTPNRRYWRVVIDGKATINRYISEDDAAKDAPRQRNFIDETNASIARSEARAAGGNP